MRTFTSSIGVNGPIVRVEIGYPRATELSLRRQGRPILAPLVLDALVDTGADTTIIDHGLLTPFVREAMSLHAIVYMNAPGVGGLCIRPQFVVGLRIPHPSGNYRFDLLLHETPVVEHALGSPGYQVLIGRDILSRCVFTFDGPANTFTLGY